VLLLLVVLLEAILATFLKEGLYCSVLGGPVVEVSRNQTAADTTAGGSSFGILP
jgi:hypothetical protein